MIYWWIIHRVESSRIYNQERRCIISGRSAAFLTPAYAQIFAHRYHSCNILIARYNYHASLSDYRESVDLSDDDRWCRSRAIYLFMMRSNLQSVRERRPSGVLRNRCRDVAAVNHYARKRGERRRGRRERIARSSSSRCLGTHAIKHFALSSVPAFAVCLRFRDSEPRLFKTTWSCAYDCSFSEIFVRSVCVYYHLSQFIYFRKFFNWNEKLNNHK